MAAGDARSEPVRRGVECLLDRQRLDGTGEELQFTEWGFPGYGPSDRPYRYEPPDSSNSQDPELIAAFMIDCSMYRNHFPLCALGRYAQAL